MSRVELVYMCYANNAEKTTVTKLLSVFYYTIKRYHFVQCYYNVMKEVMHYEVIISSLIATEFAKT